jgi:hypothetical protein
VQLAGVAPEAGGRAGRVRGTERGGLRKHGADDRHAEDVGLELHAQVVGSYAAVRLENCVSSFQPAFTIVSRFADRLPMYIP